LRESDGSKCDENSLPKLPAGPLQPEVESLRILRRAHSEELRFTAAEIAALDHELAVIELFRQRRAQAEEVTDSEFKDPKLYPIYL